LTSVRSHQTEIEEIARQIIAGQFSGSSVTADVTPGGGKTGMATVFANRLLDGGVIDSVLWVVPRLSLAEQIVDAFATGFGSCKDRRIEVRDGQDSLFSPSLPNMPVIVGAVTTYQTLASKQNYARFRDAIAPRRTLVVFDEVQFLNDDSHDESPGWYRKAKAVREAAKLTLVMSGTLWRTDNKRIPFVDYAVGQNGLQFPVAHITYSLREAVREGAILPTEWHNRNGHVEYVHNGVRTAAELLDDNDEEESRKVRTFLESEASVRSVLDRMVEDWRLWRDRAYASRMIVMADDTKAARRWYRYLEDRHSVPCVLATSKEESAGRHLRHFRERRAGQCLVTVAMAYVGFDCPDLTHLAYLSSIRAPSWMLQSFARVSRFDSKSTLDYDGQHAFIYAPDDARMREFIGWLRDQQRMGISERHGGGGGQSQKETIDVPDEFEPLVGTPGDLAIESLHGRLDPEQLSQVDALVRKCPGAACVPKSVLYEIIRTTGPNLA
jgi:superfamily II DNA or RNA helicase